MQAVKILRKLFGSLVWKIQTNDPLLFLTFDDGPIPIVTPWVLDQLNQYNAKATFFCIGDNVSKHPDIFRKIISQGHAFGNHTYHHLNGWKTKNKLYADDAAQCDTVLIRESGDPQKMTINFFRPPYGKIKPSQVSALKKKYKIIMWDILSKDYDAALKGEDCVRRVIKNTKPGSIIVFHDSLKAEERLRYALPKILAHYSEKGYRFEAIPMHLSQRFNQDNQKRI